MAGAHINACAGRRADAIMGRFLPAFRFSMFLRVRDLELRKIRYDETFEPGAIDFTGEDLEQLSPLHATGVAELLEDSDGEIRVQGRYTVEIGAQCDRCLGSARFP